MKPQMPRENMYKNDIFIEIPPRKPNERHQLMIKLLELHRFRSIKQLRGLFLSIKFLFFNQRVEGKRIKLWKTQPVVHSRSLSMTVWRFNRFCFVCDSKSTGTKIGHFWQACMFAWNQFGSVVGSYIPMHNNDQCLWFSMMKGLLIGLIIHLGILSIRSN